MISQMTQIIYKKKKKEIACNTYVWIHVKLNTIFIIKI